MSACSEYNGILCLFKPKGFTSFDAVAKLRGIFHMKRIGHGGTLDPMAEGVLPVFLGRACAACDILPDKDKTYRAGFRLGVSSDTQDITGTLSEEKDASHITEDIIEEELNNFRGEILQLPPMYSAVSVGGKRLYELARQGKTVERRPRKITIYSLKLISYNSEAHEGQLEITCSKGTYIRTLINDIGENLNTGAVMTSLLRTKACGMAVEDAVTFEALQAAKDTEGGLERYVRPVDEVFGYLPKVYLTPKEQWLYGNGVQLDGNIVGCGLSGNVGVYGDELIGTAEIADDRLKCGKTFSPPMVSRSKGCAAALGIFDGVHKGHRNVIAEAVKTAEEKGLDPAAFTFRTRSMSGEGKELFSRCILDEEEKFRRIRSCGCENIFAPPFELFKDMSAESFVKNVLLRRMDVRYIVCGEDFRCGKGAACGNAELEKICSSLNIGFKTVSLLPDEQGEKISSGRIRELIADGDVSAAAKLMDGHYTVRGRVINGKKLGRTLGFPTVNQILQPYMLMPKFGVYSSEVHICGKIFRGLSNVGIKPTVTDAAVPLCETHIFDFEGDVYGMNAEVLLMSFVREERKFSSVEELKKQVLSDIRECRAFFDNEIG